MSTYKVMSVSFPILRSHSTYTRVISKESDAHKNIFSLVRFKQRYNPGMYHVKKTRIPERWEDALEQLLKYENVKSLTARADELARYLRFRRLPTDPEEFKLKVEKAQDRVLRKDTLIDQFLSEKELKSLQQSRENQAKRELASLIYPWEPLKFNHALSIAYIASRTPAEFAALTRIFSEIKKRDENFRPQSLFDFGSGVGSVLWAAHEFWSSSLKEHLCVDVSKEINDIAELITKKGISSGQPMIPNVYYRQFMPMSSDRKYDLVVSAYSLMEQSSAKMRIEMIDLLWKKTRNYLVIVEPGTKAGFQIVNEARDYALQLHKSYGQIEAETHDEVVDIKEGHAFSPCPNDTFCPKKLKVKETACNFNVKYRPLLPFSADETKLEIFSYVVLKKGPRSPHESNSWPRLVESPLPRSRHSICRLCTKEGTLVESVFTKKKHARGIYKCARKAERGDALPVTYELKQDGEYEFIDQNQDLEDSNNCLSETINISEESDSDSDTDTQKTDK